MLLIPVKTSLAVELPRAATGSSVSGIKAKLLLCCYANPQDNDYLQGNVATVINEMRKCLNWGADCKKRAVTEREP